MIRANSQNYRVICSFDLKIKSKYRTYHAEMTEGTYSHRDNSFIPLRSVTYTLFNCFLFIDIMSSNNQYKYIHVLIHVR